MTVTMRLEGFSELEKELERLANPSQRKASARRAMKASAEPIVSAARAMAPRGETNTLAPSVAYGTKLSKRQAAQHRRSVSERSGVEAFIGAGPFSSAWNQEFGNRHHAAQPFLRPAWDAGQAAMLDRLKVELWADIQKAVARAERRAARLAVRAG